MFTGCVGRVLHNGIVVQEGHWLIERISSFIATVIVLSCFGSKGVGLRLHFVRDVHSVSFVNADVGVQGEAGIIADGFVFDCDFG